MPCQIQLKLNTSQCRTKAWQSKILICTKSQHIQNWPIVGRIRPTKPNLTSEEAKTTELKKSNPALDLNQYTAPEQQKFPTETETKSSPLNTLMSPKYQMQTVSGSELITSVKLTQLLRLRTPMEILKMAKRFNRSLVFLTTSFLLARSVIINTQMLNLNGSRTTNCSRLLNSFSS